MMALTRISVVPGSYPLGHCLLAPTGQYNHGSDFWCAVTTLKASVARGPLSALVDTCTILESAPFVNPARLKEVDAPCMSA